MNEYAIGTHGNMILSVITKPINDPQQGLHYSTGNQSLATWPRNNDRLFI